MEYKTPFSDGWLKDTISEERDFICRRINECFDDDEYNEHEDNMEAVVAKSLESISDKIIKNFERVFNQTTEELIKTHHHEETSLRHTLTEENAKDKNEYYNKLKELNEYIVQQVLPILLQKIPDSKKDLL